MLDKSRVDPKITDWLKDQGCESVEELGNWVDKTADLAPKILDKLPQDVKGDDQWVQAQTSRLRLAWRQADAITSRGIKRMAEGISEEPMDDPLDDAVHKDAIAKFKKAYGWVDLPTEIMGSDSLLGRIFREFKKKAHTLLPLSKVKSLADTSGGGSHKRRTLLPGLIIESSSALDDESDSSVAHFMEFLGRLEVLTNTWAVAGVFEASHESKMVKYCAWPEACEYLREMRTHGETALYDYTERSVVCYVVAVEEALRKKVIEGARGESAPPFGSVLKETTGKYAHFWQEKKHLLVNKNPGGRVGGNAGGGDPKGKGKKGRDARGGSTQQQSTQPAGKGSKGTKGKGKGDLAQTVSSNARKRWDIAYEGADSWRICTRFNDKRGCVWPCPNNCSHVCNVLLQSGKVCGAGNHNRFSHDEGRHGKAGFAQSRR